MQDMAGLFKISVTVVLSTNVWVIHANHNESVTMMNVSSLRYDPCGIPVDISNHSETMSPIFAL